MERMLEVASLVAVLSPFSTAAPPSQKCATAAVTLLVGIAIGSFLSGVGRRSI